MEPTNLIGAFAVGYGLALALTAILGLLSRKGGGE